MIRQDLDSRSTACGKDGEGAWTWIPDLKTHSSAGTVVFLYVYLAVNGALLISGIRERRRGGEMTVMGLPVNVTFPVSYDRLTIAYYLTILDNPLTDLTIASLLLHNCFTAITSPLHKLKMAYFAALSAEYFCQQGR